MRKTTVYLPDDLKAALARVAAREGMSEAELLRDAVQRRVTAAERPRPRLPLTGRPLGDPTAADRVDEVLAEGFGR